MYSQLFGRSVPRFLPAADGWTSHSSQVQLHLRLDGATWAWSDGTTVTLRFRGAHPDRYLEPITPVPGRVQHRRGSERLRGRRSVKGYRSVRYAALWPGIDLLFRAEGSAIKYEFRVAPGADPALIQLEWEGVERLSVDAEGNLLLHGQGWVLTDLAPLAWQPAEVHLAAPKGLGIPSAVEQAGEGGRPIPVTYAVGEDGSFGFSLMAYDSRRSLVIDPELVSPTAARRVRKDPT